MIYKPELLHSVNANEERGFEAEAYSPVVEIRKIPELPRGFFNAAACKLDDNPNGSTLLLGRHVENEAVPGEPDIGPLAIVILNHDTATAFQEVWRPEPGRAGDLLEDPRLVTLPDGNIFMGLTRLAFYNGRYQPFPAISVASPHALLHGEFPQTQLVTGLGSGEETIPLGSAQYNVTFGKNAMPIMPNQAMFRREDDNHRFVIFSVNELGAAHKLQYLEFPEGSIPYWGKNRMGLTMPPIWLNENEALLLVHGFNNLNGRLKYHIGSCRLYVDESGKYTLDNLSEEPLLAPESFRDIFPGEQVERHPEERDALYLCGGVPIYDAEGNLKLINTYPSVGDTYTVKATLSATEIMKNWRRDELFSRTQFAAA